MNLLLAQSKLFIDLDVTNGAVKIAAQVIFQAGIMQLNLL